MAVRLMVQRIVCFGAVILALLCCPGCRVLVQNRYAVFGFDGFQTEYAEEARAWSLALLVGVAVVSAAVGATGIWLGPRLYHGWREGQAAACSQREPDVIRGPERRLEMRIVDAAIEKRTNRKADCDHDAHGTSER